MKQLVKNYTFSASGKTVTLTDYGTILLERLQLIIDTTTNTVLYNFADSTVATATVATNVVTLSTVGSASSSDKLQIIYDSQTGDPTYDTPVLPNGASTSSAQTTGNSSLSTIVTNTGNSATSANQTNGTQQAKLTDGTNISSVVAGDVGFNGVAVASAVKTYTFTTSASGAQTLLANTSTEGFAEIEVVYTSIGSGLALTGQWSTVSGGTYVSPATQFWTNSSSSQVGSLGVASNVIYSGPVLGNFFQLVVSALTSGTFTGTVTLRAVSPPRVTNYATQAGTWTVGANSATGSAVPANAFYMAAQNGTGNLTGLAMGNAISDTSTLSTQLASGLYVYNGTNWDRARQATSASNTTGTGLLGAGLLEFDGTNYQRVPSARFAPSSTSLNTYSAQISTNTTTTPTASTAYISSIVVSVTGAGTTSTLTIKDKQGTPLTLVNALSTAALSAGDTQFNFQTPIKMVSGIDIVTAGAAAATVSVFVNYYQ